jgi:outer membrane biosynthesis protein TonB
VVVGGTVRLDFITLVPDESGSGARPKPVVQHRLFMPTDAFLATVRRFSEAADAIAKLEQERGAQSGQVAEAAPPPTPPAPPPEPEPPKPEAAPSEPPQPTERPKPPFP